MATIYTEEQLNKLCKVYQELLRIQDWNIRVTIVPEGEIEGASGQHNSDLGLMTSHIRICSEESFTPRHASPELDMQQVLLHELVHIVFSTLGPGEDDEVKHTLWESGIDRIACALQSLLSEPDFGDTDELVECYVCLEMKPIHTMLRLKDSGNWRCKVDCPARNREDNE